jgi:ribosome modulation factor
MRGTYKEGYQAAIDNQPFWMNPYTDSNSLILDSQTWFAGWCCGKRYLELLVKQEDKGEL